MEREDYLLRVTRDVAAMLTRILGLRDTVRYEDALAECDHAIRKVTGLDPQVLHAFRAEDVLVLMGMHDERDERRMETLQTLLGIQAEVLELAGRADEASAHRRTAAALAAAGES